MADNQPTRANEERRRDAAFSAGLKSIPNVSHKQDLTASTQVLDLSALGSGAADLRGTWIEIQALGGPVTIKRGNHTLTHLTTGRVLADGETVEYFLERSEFELHVDDHKLSIIAADTTPDLMILWSSRKQAA